MGDASAYNSISAQALDKLLAAHDGDVALLYLYWLSHGDLDEEGAAGALCRTRQDICAAKEKLVRLGLPEGAAALPSSPAPAAAPNPVEPAPPEELPQYTAAEISRMTRENSALQVIYDEAATVMGKALNSNELRVFLGIFDHLALPPEVILELLHYSAELNNWKYNGERRLTAHFVEQEAYKWANREILTLEQAEEYIRVQRERHSDIGQIQTALRLPTLSPTQEKDLESWLEMGFGEEAILIAADRTITNTNALKWSYLRKILLSWHEKGLHSPAEIREKDPSRARSAASTPAREEKPVDRKTLQSIFNKI